MSQEWQADEEVICSYECTQAIEQECARRGVDTQHEVQWFL